MNGGSDGEDSGDEDDDQGIVLYAMLYTVISSNVVFLFRI